MEEKLLFFLAIDNVLHEYNKPFQDLADEEFIAIKSKAIELYGEDVDVMERKVMRKYSTIHSKLLKELTKWDCI